MSKDQKPQILLTNDDGIRSDGLWAAAEALSEIGFALNAKKEVYGFGTWDIPGVKKLDSIEEFRKVLRRGNDRL